MKNLIKISLIFFSLTVFITACGDDDCDVLTETIVGTWESAPLGTGDFEFQDDGSVIDDNDLLIDSEFNGSALNEKTWRVETGDVLFIRASDGTQFLEAELNVPSFVCDTITVEQSGVMIDFVRK